jgi:hypothetical protein
MGPFFLFYWQQSGQKITLPYKAVILPFVQSWPGVGITNAVWINVSAQPIFNH